MTGTLARATIRQRVQLLAVAFAIGLLLIGIVGPLAVRERDAAARDQRVRIEPLRTGVSDLRLATVDQRSHVRGYLLVDDASLLTSYEQSRRDAQAILVRLERLSAGDPQFEAAIDGVRDAIDRWEQDAAQPVIDRVRVGDVEEALRIERSGLNQQLFEDVTTQTTQLREELIGQLQTSDERVTAARDRLTVLLWALALSGIAFVLLTGVLLRRWVTAPLERLGAEVEAVTRGDRHRSIPEVGPPDLAALARNVEAMRAETVDRLDELVRANEALEQQGPAVVTLRAELAPSGTSLPDDIEFAAAFQPAQGVLAGDWYDVLDLGDGRLALLMVDVSGHGPGAGVFALRAKHLLLAAMVDGPSPGDALRWVADRIGETGERFFTGLVVEVDTQTGGVRYANAGHPPPVVHDADGRTVRLWPTGPILGPLPGTWATVSLTLEPGSELVLFTDGLVEARDSAGRFFGDEGLFHVLASGAAPAETVQACLDGIRQFSNGHVGDDVTMMVLRVRDQPSAADAA